MPTVRIGNAPGPCAHAEHDPVKTQWRQPGTYEHTCPSCGHRQLFVVGGKYRWNDSSVIDGKW